MSSIIFATMVTAMMIRLNTTNVSTSRVVHLLLFGVGASCVIRFLLMFPV